MTMSEGSTRSESERPHYWHPAYKKALKLTKELPCPTCGKGYVRVFSHEQTGHGGQARCPDCSAHWRVHDGLPVEQYVEPRLGQYAQLNQLAQEWVYNPWEDVEARLDGTAEEEPNAAYLAECVRQQQEIEAAAVAAKQARQAKQEAYKQRLLTTDSQLLADREYRKWTVIDPLIRVIREYWAAKDKDAEAEARWWAVLTKLRAIVCEDCASLAMRSRRQLCRRHHADPGAPEHK